MSEGTMTINGVPVEVGVQRVGYSKWRISGSWPIPQPILSNQYRHVDVSFSDGSFVRALIGNGTGGIEWWSFELDGAVIE